MPEILLTRTLSHIVLVLYISQNSLRISRIALFPVEKHTKSIYIFCESEICEIYCIFTLFYGSFKAGDSARGHFIMWHVPLCNQ